jgi:hypothetical protein
MEFMVILLVIVLLGIFEVWKDRTEAAWCDRVCARIEEAFREARELDSLQESSTRPEPPNPSSATASAAAAGRPATATASSPDASG